MGNVTYTVSAKNAALEYVRKGGLPLAAKETGIPKMTLSRWAKDAGIDVTREKQTKAATEKNHREWVLRRLEEANAAGETAARAREALLAAIEAGDIKGRDLATVYGILVDKAQILSDGATARVDSVVTERSELDAEIERLLGEFRQGESAVERSGSVGKVGV